MKNFLFSMRILLQFIKKAFLTGCFLLVDVFTLLLELSKKSEAVVGLSTSFLGFDLAFFVGESKITQTNKTITVSITKELMIKTTMVFKRI